MSYTCKKCGWTGEPNGRRRCLRCAKERTAKWRLENPNKVKAQQKIAVRRMKELRQTNRDLVFALNEIVNISDVDGMNSTNAIPDFRVIGVRFVFLRITKIAREAIAKTADNAITKARGEKGCEV